MATITRETLPHAYRSLIPCESGKFPIEANIKNKLNWYCQDCGAHIELSIDNMRANQEPELNNGCRFCSSALRQGTHVERETQHRLRAWRFDHGHPQAKNMRRRMEALTFTLACPKGHAFDLDRSALHYFMRSGEQCQKCRNEQGALENNCAVEHIRQHWPEATIGFIESGQISEGSTSPCKPIYRVDIPGPDKAPTPDTNRRIRGKLKQARISIVKLKKAHSQDLKDRERMRRLIEIGAKYGSDVDKFCFPKGQTNELAAQYQTAAGNITPPYTKGRAEEYCAGRTKMKQTQAMIMATVKELLPDRCRWEMDNRTILAHLSGNHELRWELDIGTPEFVPGGFWIEYQGHQSHRENPDVIRRDRKKVDICRDHALLLIIERIEKPTPKKIIKQIQESLKSHPDKDRVAKLRTQMLNPDLSAISKRYERYNVERAISTGKQLDDALASHGHKLRTLLPKILRSNTFSMVCGSCSRRVEGLSVAQYIDNPASGCTRCRSERAIAAGRNRREHKWSAYDWWESTDSKTKELLVCAEDSFPCPWCRRPIWKETLAKRDDFLCIHCWDTGDVMTESGAQAGALYQHLDTILRLIREIDEAPHNHVRQQVDYADNSIHLTMTVQGESVRLPLTVWHRERKKRFSMYLHAPEREHPQLLRAYPHIKFLGAPDGYLRFQCGCATEAPDGAHIVHPAKTIRTRQLAKLVRDHGHALSKKLCYLHTVQADEASSVKKSLADIKARWRLRATIIGIGHIPIQHRRPPAVGSAKATADDFISTTEKLMFLCTDARHDVIRRTTDNMFSPYKPGFCQHCLKAAGKKELNLGWEERDAAINAKS